MAVTFDIQFRISVSTKVIRLTNTSSGFTFNKGCFKVQFPNGVVRNLPDFSTPDITTSINYIDIPCEVNVNGSVITGSYVISFAAIDNAGNGQTPLSRTFDFNWIEPTNGITNLSDVLLPEVVFSDVTSYSPIGSFTGTLTRTLSSSFPSTSEVSGNSPITSTVSNTIRVISATNYYEGVYTPTSNVSVAYTHSSNSWLTILYTRTFSSTFAIKKCPSQLELVTKINSYRAIIDAYKLTNDTQFNILSNQYDIVISLYSHLIARYNTSTQDGSEPILRELLSILEPYAGTYSYQATKMLPFALSVSGSNSFIISDGTNIDTIPLGSTLTFASGNSALLPIVTDNIVTYSPTFGTALNTFAQGNDSRFHTPVTIGTANGLSISTQALSLAAATSGSAGAMSASDKTKLDGIASGATANTGTVTSVALTVPSAFSISGSPITTSGTLAIAATGLSSQYITGAGALATLNTANVPENTNLYFTSARARTSISLTTTGTSGAATYDNATGILNIPSYIGGVTSFNTRTGAIVLSSSDVTTALTYTPYNASNPSGYISSITSANVISALGYTPYNATNPSAYISLTSLSFVAGSGGYNNTTGVITIPTNNTQITNGSNYITLASLSFVAGSGAYNNTTGVITIPTNNSQLTNGAGYITGITSGNVTTALGFTPENSANKGIANGYASLDGGGLVPATQLPSYVDDVLEYTNLASFPATGETGKIYVDLATNKIYRWSGSAYIEVSPTVGTIWGGITGTLSNQTDLQNALNAKQATLSGTGFVKSTAGTISYDTNTYLTTSSATTTYVPYTGASGNVNLGTNNISANNFLNAFSNITASGTQVVLTVASAPEIVVNGSGGQTIKLPDATTLANGASFLFNNNQSSGAITINNNSNTLVVSVPSGGYCEVILIDNTTAAGSYDRHFHAPSNVSWSTNTFDYAGSITSATWNGNVIQPNRGGTGQSTYTDGQLLIGNTSGNTLSKATLSAGTGITITNGNGSISIATTINQYTDALARASLSFTAGSGAYNSTTGVITIPTNNTQITNGANYITLTSLSATSPIVYTNTTGVISIPVATTSVNGYLSSTDWTTFNNKANALSGTANKITKFTSTTAIGDSSITDTGSLVTIASPLTLSGAVTGTGNLSNYTVTASSGSAISKKITSTLVAAANSDVLIGLDINPTYTPGSFTGVTNIGIRVKGDIQLSASGNSIVSYAGINLLTQSSAGVQLSNAVSGGYFRILQFAASTWALYTFGATGNTQINSGSTDLGYKFQVTGTTQFQGTTASDTAPLGSELAGVTGTGTNWALATSATNLNVGGYTHTVGSTTALTTSLAAVSGTYYQITYTITGRTAGDITVTYGGISSGLVSSTAILSGLASSTAVLTITPTTTFDGTVVLSIKSVGISSASSTFANSSGVSIIETRASSIANNTFIGLNAGSRNTVGIYNTFIGNAAGQNNISGSYNTAIGGALQNNTLGINNSALGLNALQNNTLGSNNSAFGNSAGQQNTTGGSNTFIGVSAGNTNTTGGSNTFVGLSAGQFSTTGGNNSAFGTAAGQSISTGTGNTSIGVSAIRNNISGNNNIGLGVQAGQYISDGSTSNAITDNSIYIGYNTKALANNQTNQIVIGYQTTGLGSNTTVLGNSSTVTTAIYGNLLLGSTTDAGYKLDVTGTARVTTSAYFATASGSVGIGTTSASYKLSVVGANATDMISWTDNTNNTGYLGIRTGSAVWLGADNNLVFGTAATERIRITVAGLIGIGTSNPTRSFQITRTSTAFINAEGTTVALGSSDAPLAFYSNNVNTLNITSAGAATFTSSVTANANFYASSTAPTYILTNASQSTTYGYLQHNATDLTLFNNVSSGRLYCQNISAGVYLAASGVAWIANSDERLKTDLVPIENAINKVSLLRSVIGRYKTDEIGTKRPFLIAQDVLDVLPEAVDKDEKTGYLGVSYTEIIPLLVASIKELSAEITILKNK